MVTVLKSPPKIRAPEAGELAYSPASASRTGVAVGNVSLPLFHMLPLWPSGCLDLTLVYHFVTTSMLTLKITPVVRACCCPCSIASSTAQSMKMTSPFLHGVLGGIPPLCYIHAIFMRIRIKAKFGIHYGIPLPQDCIAAVLCHPCALVQHRADVTGGYRLRRDQVITMQAIPVTSAVTETDERWALKRYIPGAQVVAASPEQQEEM